MNYAVGVTALASVLVGFLAGLLTFKTKARWCPQCGLALRCPRCLLTPREAMRK